MSAPSQLDLFFIELDVDRRPALRLSLSADGAITRYHSGTGSSIGNKDEHCFIAQLPPGCTFFREIAELFDPSWLLRAGVYETPDQLGAACSLRLTLSAGGRLAVLEYRYGAQSQGPPRDIRQFVIRAIEVTQSWYDEQNRIENQRSNR